MKPWSGKNPFLLKITLHQDRGVSQGGYVNLLPFVRGGDGYPRGYSGGCQHVLLKLRKNIYRAGVKERRKRTA